MYNIRVKGQAETSFDDLKQLDGIDCQDNFSDYFGSDEKLLVDKGVNGGYMHFEYDKDINKLMTITTYQSRERLNEEELKTLADYTSGQWSDGIGEGFEQYPQYIENEEVYISPWFFGQKVITEITEN